MKKLLIPIGAPVVLDLVAYVLMVTINHGWEYIHSLQNGRFVYLYAVLNFSAFLLLAFAQVLSFRSIDAALGMSMKTDHARKLFIQGVAGFLLFLPWFLYFGITTLGMLLFH